MDADLSIVNYPKYAKTLNGGVAVLGTGASTVGATAINVDGIAADAKVVYTFGPYGGFCEALMISTNDTAAVNAIIYMMDGATVHHLAVVNIPIASGTNGTAPNVDVINAIQGLPINPLFKKVIQGKPNVTIKVAVLAAMTANKILIAKSSGIDFEA
jgi:hypothetical protein